MPSIRDARYALAGLEAGMAGALALLVWMALASRFFGKSVWWIPNLLGSAFYGEAALRYAPGRYTYAGAALVLFCYTVVGILFGLMWRDRPRGASVLFTSVGVGVVAYYVLIKLLWRHFSPAGAIYSPDRQIFLGHIVFGFLLARFPAFRDRLMPPGAAGYEASR